MARPMSNVRQSSLAPPPAWAPESADFFLSAYSLRPPVSSRERPDPDRPARGSAPAPGEPTSAMLLPALRTDTASSSAPTGWGASGTEERRASRDSGAGGGHVGTEETPGVSTSSSDGGAAAALPPPRGSPRELLAAGASISDSSPDALVSRLRLDASPAALPAGSLTDARPLNAGARRLPNARCCTSIARHSPGTKL